MRPVAPRTGAEEFTFAEEQGEYKPVIIGVYPGYFGSNSRGLLWRYTFTAEEREAIAKGEDIYIMQLNFNQPMTPMAASVGPGAWLVQTP